MNLVAHQLLSGYNKKLMLGNLLGDFVRGKFQHLYPKEIASGILLHREIDSFTDLNPIVRQSSLRVRETQKKYAPVVVDLYYDYFLIQHWDEFCEINFHEFKTQCYQNFLANLNWFGPKHQTIVKVMVQQDWFENYATLSGIELTLINIGKRRKYSNQMHLAGKNLSQFKKEIEQDFLTFYPILQQHCSTFIAQLS